jgi:hypothetical protein
MNSLSVVFKASSDKELCNNKIYKLGKIT